MYATLRKKGANSRFSDFFALCEDVTCAVGCVGVVYALVPHSWFM